MKMKGSPQTCGGLSRRQQYTILRPLHTAFWCVCVCSRLFVKEWEVQASHRADQFLHGTKDQTDSDSHIGTNHVCNLDHSVDHSIDLVSMHFGLAEPIRILDLGKHAGEGQEISENFEIILILNQSRVPYVDLNLFVLQCAPSRRINHKFVLGNNWIFVNSQNRTKWNAKHNNTK